MYKIKWLFFGYLGMVGLLVASLAVAFVKTPPRDSGTYYTSYSANLKTLDPAEIDDTESSSIVGGIYETLYNYKYGVNPYEEFPQIAAEMPVVSPDGKTMTIKLRKGIHFYDPWRKVFPDGVGPEIKAQDYIYSWKRVSNFQLGNTANYSAIFEGKIQGLDDWWEYTKSCDPDKIDWDRPVSGWTALDDQTIQIKLVEPYPQLRYNLAHLPTSAVCREAVEKLGKDFKKYPIGSGPFVLKEHLPEQRIILEANPTYRGRMDVDGYAKVNPEDRLPRMKRIQLDYFTEPVPTWLLFRQGFFDVSGIPRDAFTQAISSASGGLTPEMAADGVTLTKSVVAEVSYIGFNMLDPVVGKNKALRQAMSLAYDRETYIRIYLNGRGQPATGPIPPGFPTYSPEHASPWSRFDLAAAREKMKEAERINGGPIPPLTLLIGGTETQARQSAEFFVAQMEQIGLKVNFELRTWARFQEMVDNKQEQLFGLGWVADYPDEQTFLQLFYSKNAGVGGNNAANYANADYDKLYEQARVMDPGPARDGLYVKLQEIANEDCPWIYEMYPIAYGLRYTWVKNAKFMEYGNGGTLAWSYISVDSDARNAWIKRHR